MHVKLVFFCAALLFGMGPNARAQQHGFAGLGAASDGYADVVPGREISFPADYGAHHEHRIEWWYVTANLTGEDGLPYGIQWTLFRQASTPSPQREGWSSQQFWLGHAALTSATTHRHAEKLGRGGVGQADVTAQPFDAWIDDWHLSSTGGAFSPLTLEANGEDFGYALTFETTQPMVLQGDKGFSLKSERGQASYYVSQPFFEAKGTLHIDDKQIAISGQAWMDREWSSQPLAPDQEGWDWFSLHLASGEKVMLFRLRHKGGEHFFAGNWISPQGKSTVIAPSDIVLTPLREVKTDGGTHPVEWRLQVKSRGLDVTAKALNENAWNDTLFPYWEGPITVSGSEDGVGYLEMTGY